MWHFVTGKSDLDNKIIRAILEAIKIPGDSPVKYVRGIDVTIHKTTPKKGE